MKRKLSKLIKDNLKRPFKLVIIKGMTEFWYSLYLKSDKHEKTFYKWMKRKENYFNSYFKKHFSYILKIGALKEKKLNTKPIIFVFWYQGFENLPSIVDFCIKSIKENGKNYDVILLSKDNYSKYISLDKTIEDRFQNKKISIQNFADYLRIKLLEQYNCLWVDATVFAIKEIPLSYSELEYFSIKSPNIYDGKKEYSLCPLFPFGQVYLLGGTNKRFYHQIATFFENYIKKRDVYLDYFMIYYFMNFLYLNDSEDKKIIDALPINNEHIEDYFYYRGEPYSKKKFSEEDVFAKLSYKIDSEKEINTQGSVLNKLFEKYL